MKKLRRFLTVLLFINFSWGMATGMEPLNFWLVMANGKKESKIPQEKRNLQSDAELQRGVKWHI